MKSITFTTSLLLLITLTFTSCSENKTSNNKKEVDVLKAEDPLQEELDYLELGKEIALKTKGNLGKYLIPALGSFGSEGALDICNTKAIQITDSMAKELNASIKRVSDKPRNQSNQANDSELAYIQKWKESNENGESQGPELLEIDGKIVGYYPIITNQMCIQCHGVPMEDINKATLAKINTLYPNDKATGYKSDEIRGLFVVGMDKK